ncbi:MAG TPA: hypothetical protein VFE48_24370 [Methylomirabilota bacterium]|nr:hypothetical protein [Methylomirabilota bacterium]
MSRSPIRVWWTLVLTLACAGCGGIPTRQLIREVMPFTREVASTCPQPPDSPAEARLRERARAVVARLHEHKVVDFVVDAIHAGASPSLSARERFAMLHDLNASLLKDFGRRIQERFLRHDLQEPSTDSAETRARLAADVHEFNQVLVAYVSAYVDGKYVDRFGTILPAPAISRTIGNTEIAGVVSVIIDAVGDYLVRGPVWTEKGDKGPLYYPASFSKDAADLALKDPKAPPLEPTVVGVRIKAPGQGGEGSPLIQTVPLVAEGCGITKDKARAIEYVGQTAALKASMVGGITGGSFGGFGASFGAFGKVSVGDNQTVQVVIKTVLGKVAERVAADAAYRVFYRVPEKAQLAELVQKYLDLLETQPGDAG